MNSAIQSPCIQVCELNSDEVCSGCYRTSDEIGRWLIFTEEERAKIMLALSQRRADYLASCFD